MNSTPTHAKATHPAHAAPASADRWADLLSGRHLAIVLVMASGVLLYAMNLYFTAALMPSIAADIGGEQYYAWVTTGFVIAAIVASLFVSGALGWRGPARAYFIAFTAFALGGALIAASPTMELLILGRVVQGLGGGLLVGLGYAVIRAALPERHWARATGVVSAMWGLGTLFGPSLGGIFAQLGLWRWSYASLGLFALLFALIAGGAFSKVQSSGHRARVPVASLIPLIMAVVAISCSSLVPVGWQTLGLIGVGLVFFVLFVIVERREHDTVLPHLTYRRGNALKWVYLTVAALSAGVMVEIFIPLFGQRLAGLNPLYAGLLGAVLSLAWVVAQIFIVSVQSKSGRSRAMRIGPLLLTTGLLAYGLLQVTEAGAGMVLLWVGALTVAGVGIGLAWPLLG
ncbi:multidrug transporter, partial [Cephaloticoccus primus]